MQTISASEQKTSVVSEPVREVLKTESREWWLWGLAVTVTLVLTVGIVALTVPHSPLLDEEWFDLKEWVRGLAALVLLFDIYTIYQHWQLHRVRRTLAEQGQLFRLISENAADMIALVDRDGHRPITVRHIRPCWATRPRNSVLPHPWIKSTPMTVSE